MNKYHIDEDWILRPEKKFPPVRILLSLALTVLVGGWAVFDFFIGGNSSLPAESSIPLPAEVSIFGFHDVVDLNNRKDLPPNRREFDSDYTKQDLKVFLEYLLENNYWFLSSTEFYEYFIKRTKKIPAEHLSEKPIMLTFDDGYRGIYSSLLPLLREMEKKYSKKVKIVLFVNPGLMGVVDQDINYLTCDNLREGLEASFFDVQSHGLSHRKLTELPEKDIVMELAKSKFILRQCTKDLDPKKEVADFLAFPNGATNKKVEKYTSAYYSAAFLYNNKLFESASRQNNRYQIHRLMAYRAIKPERLIEIVKQNEEKTLARNN